MVLSGYRDAERAPTDLAAGLYSILREGESMHSVWGTPLKLRTRLIAVVTTLRADIDSGDSRTCQAAIEDLSVPLRRPRVEGELELADAAAPAPGSKGAGERTALRLIADGRIRTDYQFIES